MTFPKLDTAVGDIRRFRHVLAVLFEEGLSFFIDALKLRYLVPARSRLRCAISRGAAECRRALFREKMEPPPPARLRRAFERLGPTFIKLGQILSMRPDVVPPEYVAEFSKLREDVKPLAPGVAEKIVESELGQLIENIFASFEEKPLAAASLAVVHRARLKDGTAVAVKIRRPGVVETAKNDIHILAYLAHLLERYVSESRRFQPVRVVQEFAHWTLRELDFEVEGANIDRFRKNFSDDHSVIIPRVFWDYTTKAVLVTELSEGVGILDFAGLKRAGIDRKELARIGINAGLKMFFADGFFHADPHPGNVRALPPLAGAAPEWRPRPRLTLYDFGIVGSLSEKTRYELGSCFLSFLNKDTDSYVNHILDLAEAAEGADIATFSRVVRDIVSDVLYKPTERKGIAAAFYRVLLAGGKHEIFFPSDLILLGKAFLTLETIVFQLYPEIDLDAELRPFFIEALTKEFRPSAAVKAAESITFDALYFLKHLPEQTRLLLDRMSKGELGVKVNLDELKDLKAEFDRQNDVRVLAILASALLVGSALALRLDQRAVVYGISLGRIGFAVAIIVVLWLFFLVRRKP